MASSWHDSDARSDVEARSAAEGLIARMLHGVLAVAAMLQC